MSHDEIVLSLTDEKLIMLLNPLYGEQGIWSNFSFVVQKEVGEWNIGETRMIVNIYNTAEYQSISLDTIKTNFTKAHDFINTVPLKESLTISKTIEFPLTKGEQQYKVTKGFIDLIVHIKPIQVLHYSTYSNTGPTEVVIEIKTEKDFIDMGQILRQINEYKCYYDDKWSCKQWHSPLIPSREIEQRRVYAILSTKIPPNIKKLFEAEKIICFELDNINS
ncbi:MAG: hypothetical protein Q8O68_00500 [Candidatus Daviesbacteria bacterium]|nr:hypothetical protein [Candidatus Daviesbacteria bacterium]